MSTLQLLVLMAYTPFRSIIRSLTFFTEWLERSFGFIPDAEVFRNALQLLAWTSTLLQLHTSLDH